MKNALAELDALITITLQQPAADHTKKYLEEAAQIIDRIRRVLLYPQDAVLTEAQCKQQVHQYQAALVYLCDQLFHYQNETKQLSLSDLYAAVIEMIENLLSLIEKRFPQYFNTAEKLTDAFAEKQQKSFSQMLSSLHKNFKKRMEDGVLLSIVFAAIGLFSNHSANSHITHHHFRYVQILMTEMHHLLSRKELMRMDLIRLLVCVNFNTIKFKKYLIDIIIADIDSAADAAERNKKLHFYYLQMNQIIVMPDMAFYADTVSVKEDIIQWLKTALQYQPDGMNTTTNLALSAKEKEEGVEKGIYYLMTVEEIALLKRVMKESGYISNRNITKLMKDVSAMVHSVHQYDVSWQNLYNSFYKFDLATIEGLNEKLFVMVNRLKKMEIKLRQERRKK